VQTNPREWWDEHWIKDRILSKLAPETITAAARTPVTSRSEPATRKARRGRKR
jgi:hypothetical protein